jgi:hypothetical protein
VAVINNAYFPLMPGTTYLYHLSSADSPSQDITVTVTPRYQNDSRRDLYRGS